MRRVALGLVLAATLLAGSSRAEEDVRLRALEDAAEAMTTAISEMPRSARLPTDSVLAAGALARLRTRSTAAEVARTSRAAEARKAGAGMLEQDQEAMESLWYFTTDPPKAIRTRARAALSPERFQALDQKVKDFESLDLDRSIGIYQRRLDRYETKYGPGSPKLNLLEIGLNLLMKGAPGFGPKTDGPGPLEMLAGYSTSYVVIVDHEAQPLSALEAGLRVYYLDWNEARGWSGLWPPRYVSFGVAIASPKEGALRWPLDPADERRWGAFLTWGDLKAAYFWDDQRFAVSRQFQLVPGLF